MFKKLRNKLILINLSITTVVILVVFSAIYMISTGTANGRRVPDEIMVHTFSDEDGKTFEKIIDLSLKEEKEAAANNLLVTLIVSGIGIELSVLFVSYLMAEEAIKPVRETYEAQRVFIANASHEIKTPLAAISANLEAADIQDNKWISNVEEEVRRLTALNGELLLLAKTDLISNVATEEMPVKNEITKMLQSFEPRMQGKKYIYHVDLPEKSRINVTDLKQILSILLDNAVKYSKKKITVEVKEHELVVMNDGAKIEKKDLTRVFERFYQTDKTAEGVGLGLSIAKSLADRNKWRISAESGNETKFIVKF